jgi:hypothetical protein
MDVTVNQVHNAFNGVDSTTGIARWFGSVSLSYDYDLQALASFGTTANTITALTLDFGTLYKGDAASLDFQISNWGGSSESVALQLDGIDATGDFDQFDTEMSTLLSSPLSGGDNYSTQATPL